MRVLLVALPDDPRVARHADLLCAAGWTVDLASPRPGGFDASQYPSFRVHQPPRPTTTAGEMSPGRYAARRLRLAAARVGYRAADGVRSLTGADLGPGPFPLRPFDQSGTPREPVDRLLQVFGFWSGADATWLARLIDRLQPDAINSFGFRDGIALTLAARTRLHSGTPWLLTLTDDGLGGAETNPQLAKFVRRAFSAAGALLVERPDQLDLARGWGFAGSHYTIGPIGGGWSLRFCRTLWSDGLPSRRGTIAVSGVQHATARAFVALRGIELAADALRRHRIAVFAANDDVALAAELLQIRTGLELTVRTHLSEEDRWRLLGQARCTVALADTAMTEPVLQEAAVMGSFPIGSTTDRDRTWLRDGQTALLVWPDDPASVAAALRRAVSDDDLIDRGVAANERVAELRFDRELTGNEILGIYRRVAGVTSG